MNKKTEKAVRYALVRAEEAFATKVRVGRCLHDRSDWETLLKEVQEALALLGDPPVEDEEADADDS